MAYLTPDKIRRERINGWELVINEKIIPDNLRARRNEADHVKKGGKMKPCKPIHNDGKPQGVCIHNTEDIKTAAATNPAEQYSRATYNGHMSGARVHFYVWHDVIWQLLRLDEQGWHAGDSGKESKTLQKDGTINGNRDTIAIEIIGRDAESEQTGALLAAWLLKKFGLFHWNGLYYHKYFSGKNCPEYILPHWESFVVNFRHYYEDKKDECPVASENSQPTAVKKSVDEIGASDGDLSPGKVDYVDKLAHAAKCLNKILEGEEKGSFRRSYAGGGYADGGDRSFRRRDSMGRYSRHDDDLMSKLRTISRESDGKTRQMIDRLIEDMDQEQQTN